MKVILLADVKSHGKKGDVIEVSEGFGRNALIKKGLALEATPVNINNLKLQNKHAEKVAEENLEAAKEMAEKVKDWKVETTLKSGEGGRTFGSVSAKEIAEAVEKQYHEKIDKKKIHLPEPIRSLGVHEVTLKLHPQVTATLRVHVGEKN
ncbi:MAG: 50S ribosomal protein L9 [Lachnospiraceae bacterium]|nr:50S ribosomal protein L9 [Lachnospiraceae bacterium]